MIEYSIKGTHEMLSEIVKAGNLYFISGQTPKDKATQTVIGNNITEQAEQVMENIKAILDAAGLELTDVAKTTCYMADIKSVPEFNKVYKKYFTGKPARVCLAVKDLPNGVLCEVECIAYKE